MIQACSDQAADVAARQALVCGHPDPAAELPHWQGVRRLQALSEQAVLGQVALGVWTLLWAVPLWLGRAHQGGALVVLAAAIWNLHVALLGERAVVMRAAAAS